MMKNSSVLAVVAVLCALLCLYVFAACSKASEEQEVALEEDAGEQDEEAGIQRRKIERLDPQAFIEVTLELKREERRWRDEWQNFMQEKRDEFFESFGLNESQFNEFTIRNQRELQQFLRENPRYNQLLMRMQEEDSYQP